MEAKRILWFEAQRRSESSGRFGFRSVAVGSLQEGLETGGVKRQCAERQGGQVGGGVSKRRLKNRGER